MTTRSNRTSLLAGLPVLFLVLVVGMLAVVLQPGALAASEIKLLHVPAGGIQPQAVFDPAGTLHLVYYKGDAKAGDLYYVRKAKADTEFSEPIRVNSIEGSATSNGCISGAQMTLGKNGDVHVTWNASGAVKDRDHVVFYARLTGDHKSFEPQSNLLTQKLFIDGGGSIAADQSGDVFVFWHAWPDGKSEENGRIYLVQSEDGGQTFSPARTIDTPARGTCACCSMKAVLDSSGQLRVLYRAAAKGTKRDTMLLTSKDGGKNFESKIMQSWNGNSCPMTMFSFSSFGKDTLAAWESPGKVNIESLNQEKKFAHVQAGKSSKYPTIALNDRREVLLSWIEKEAWNKAGEARWQVFDQKGKPISKVESRKGIDVWSFTAALPHPDGGFLLIY